MQFKLSSSLLAVALAVCSAPVLANPTLIPNAEVITYVRKVDGIDVTLTALATVQFTECRAFCDTNYSGEGDQDCDADCADDYATSPCKNCNIEVAPGKTMTVEEVINTAREQRLQELALIPHPDFSCGVCRTPEDLARYTGRPRPAAIIATGVAILACKFFCG